MGIKQLQRNVNNFDKEIAELEKKKAKEDKTAAENRKKAANVNISKNSTESTIRRKMRQIESYESIAIKSEDASADYSKKIADKRILRNEAYLKLQKEEQKEKKKQEESIETMKRAYEQRISELEAMRLSKVENEFPEMDSDDEPEYDVFVSHAWEDKEAFVEDFVHALKDRDIKVWYDKTKIKWGDSMRARIDDGLRKSKFGVAILSPHYIEEGKYWTKTELDGLFQMESINGKTLLPIWHDLTKKQVMEYSPIMASKLAMTTATMTPEEIADELLNILSPEEDDKQNG